MPAPPVRGNLHVDFDCVELRFIVFCEPQCSCKFHMKIISLKPPLKPLFPKVGNLKKPNKAIITS